MRFLVLLLMLVVIDVYSFQAVRTWAQPYSHSVRTLAYTFFALLTVGSMGYLLASRMGWTEHWPNGLVTLVRAAVFIIYLSKIMVVAVLLIDDLRRGSIWIYDKLWPQHAEVDLSRSRFLSNLALLLGGIPLTTLTYGMLRNPYRYQIFRERLVVDDLPPALRGLRIVQISDIHSGSFTRTEPLTRAVQMINEQEPDVVFFTGDLVNNRAEEMAPYVDIFKQIRAKHGVFSVLGNHDYGDYVEWGSAAEKTANMERLAGIHAELGWTLLRNENRLITINGESVAVIGVENWSNIARFPRKGDLAQAYRGAERATFKVLLSHDPTHWEAQVQPNFSAIDLTLSGHTHGMQFGIEIPGFRWSPASFVYKQWAGLYRAGQQWLYVNRGFGFLGYPGRVGILPEISLLEILDKA